MYEDGKVPLSKAADVAGMPVDSFVYIASSRGIRSNIKESIKGLIDSLKTER
jgi:predicted HTH domain antitoxin